MSSSTVTPTTTPTPAVPATFLGLEWGDWASWVVALFTLASFGAVAFGLYVENRHRKEDVKTERENRKADIERVQGRQEKLDTRQNELDEQAAYLLESEQARHSLPGHLALSHHKTKTWPRLLL
jgi:predicted thioesterase